MRGTVNGSWAWLAVAALLAGPAPAQTGEDAALVRGPDRTLVVALAGGPPFVIKESDGTWSGLSVELWREIALRLQLRWEPREMELAAVGAALHDGAVDAAIGAIAIDADGETQHDYSLPYYATGLGFVERSKKGQSFAGMMKALTSSHLARLVAVIVLATLLVGVLIAFIERGQAASEFGGPLGRGIATGVWWAAVTMTTVGYGDATPKTAPGRSLALLWMFVGVAVVALFTATVTSILTVGSLHGTVHHAGDLGHLRLGAVSAGPGTRYMDRRHLRFTAFATHEEALRALAADRVDAVLANRTLLRYQVHRDWQGVLRVSPIILEPLLYAVGLPADSALREPLNRTILGIIDEDRWRDVERRYLGQT